MVKSSNRNVAGTKATRGRRPGPSVSRAAIVAAARRRFGEHGYTKTTLRAVAADAGVDPKLVSHWFPSKQDLFREVVEFPVDVSAVLAETTTDDPRPLGTRLAARVLTLFEEHDEVRLRWLSLVRAATTEPEAAAVLRDVVLRDSLNPMAAAFGGTDPELRACLVGAQMVGLLMARHVLGVEPLASLSVEELSGAVGPVLQHYLTEPLDEGPAPPAR